MKKNVRRLLTVFLAASVIFFAGCAQKETGTTAKPVEGVQETGDASIGVEDVPVLEEDDSVEIGEMLEETTTDPEAIDPAEVSVLEEDDSVDIGEMIE